MIPDAPTRLGQVVQWIQQFVAYQKINDGNRHRRTDDVRRRTECVFEDASSVFEVSCVSDSGLSLYIKGGVVNNALTVADSSAISFSATCWPAVKVTFSIAADGTVIPTGAEFDISRNADTDPHISISGSTCYAWVFLAKVTVADGVPSVAQWVNGNFFVLPLGLQKQVWYA